MTDVSNGGKSDCLRFWRKTRFIPKMGEMDLIRPETNT